MECLPPVDIPKLFSFSAWMNLGPYEAILGKGFAAFTLEYNLLSLSRSPSNRINGCTVIRVPSSVVRPGCVPEKTENNECNTCRTNVVFHARWQGQGRVGGMRGVGVGAERIMINCYILRDLADLANQ